MFASNATSTIERYTDYASNKDSIYARHALHMYNNLNTDQEEQEEIRSQEDPSPFNPIPD